MPRQDGSGRPGEMTPGGQLDGASSRDEKRSRFSQATAGSTGQQKRLSPVTLLTVGAVVLVCVVIGVGILSNSNVKTASAAPVQQVAATTAATEGGQISISAEEVLSKKLVAWNYKKDNGTIPLVAYVTPSVAAKVAIRMCEPCNSTSFHTEGNQLVCNTCGSRWDLETSRGISGGCQNYPPQVLPSNVIGGKIVVDEQNVASWKPRV